MAAALVLLAPAAMLAAASRDEGVQFACVGSCDAPKPPRSLGGNAMMGGHMYPGVATHTDLQAYRWFLQRAGPGGDVLVLTADEAPWDIYNAFLYNSSWGDLRPNSVTTARFTARCGVNSTRLQRLLSGASGLFVTGGDQARYVRWWADSPVAAALSSGVVVGGSSAGLAVQGQFAFDALHGSVDSPEALKYPTDSEVSLSRHFLDVDTPWMRSVITDTHFLQRDRMGRLVAFVARIAAQGWASGSHHRAVLGVGISEHSSVLVEHVSGAAAILGDGPVYFISSRGSRPSVCREGEPLTWEAPGVSVWRWNGSTSSNPVVQVGDGQPTWSFATWQGSRGPWGTNYSLSARLGVLHSTLPDGSIY